MYKETSTLAGRSGDVISVTEYHYSYIVLMNICRDKMGLVTNIIR